MKLTKLFTVSAFAFLMTLGAFAQDKKAVVLTIDNDQITKEEFENIFRKNNRDSVISQKSLDDYMELFINFKLKVKEARELGLDTVAKFRQELEGYRAQLARPYLTDNSMVDEMVREAYERQKEEVRARHILIKCDPNATPEDTARAYARMMAVRDRVVKGEDFETVAMAMSEDPSAKDNGGELGYFTVFQMVFPFEDAAYKTPVGQVSMPVRTRYGYHILEVEDRRAARGEIHVAHILIKPKQEADGEKNAQSKINEIYDRLLRGENFEELASKFSEDGGSAKKGGELPWFGTNKMVAEFEEASYSITKDGDICPPFKTSYGWHIVKRLGLKPVPAFADVEKELKTKVTKDSRAERTRTSFVARIKKDYNFVYRPENLKPLLAAADTNVFKGVLKVKKSALKKPLFEMEGKKYPVKDFYNVLTSRKGIKTKLSPQDYVSTEAETYAQSQLLKLEDSKLESKYDAFRLLMNEYREGILLFELTDQKVWSKAVKDTTGLQKFYNENTTKFMWPERADVTIFVCGNEGIANQARKMLAEGKDNSAIAAELNKDTQLNLQIEEGIFAREDKDVLAKVKWAKGVSDNVSLNDQVMFVNFKDVLAPAPKKLSESKGMVTSEYQNYLEQKWIQELRAKHKYTINREVLHSIH
jgi:peptidyl-prolyl cis-trans isomerase SurA